MAPLVSVILTVRDGGPEFIECLRSLAALQWRPLEVAIVDADSKDGSWEALRQFQQSAPFPVHLQRRACNIAAGRNLAVGLSSGEFLAITDADSRVPPDWVHRLMEAMQDGVGAVGGPKDGPEPAALAAAAAAIPTHGPTTKEVPLFRRSRFRHDFETRSDVFAAVTGNCLIRRRAFEEAGGFDERLSTGEDGELNQRILSQGYSIRYARAAALQHQYRTSLGAFWRQQAGYARGQAQVNRVQPRLRKAIHRLPAGALGVLVAALVASPWVGWLPAAGLALGALAVAVAYGVQAALVRRRPTLLAAAPLLLAAWMLAWAVFYPLTALRLRLGRPKTAR